MNTLLLVVVVLLFETGLVTIFSWWTRSKEIPQSFLFTSNITTKYYLKYFLPNRSWNMSKAFSSFVSLYQKRKDMLIANLILGQIIVSTLTNVHNKLAALSTRDLWKQTKYSNYSGLPVERQPLHQEKARIAEDFVTLLRVVTQCSCVAWRH